MILVDTSVWVDHFRSGDSALSTLLDAGEVLSHAFVIGELALGVLRQRDLVIGTLRNLPQANAATDGEVLEFINHNELAGRGIGYVDAHLLASAKLTAEASLWTRDKRLLAVALQLDLLTRLQA